MSWVRFSLIAGSVVAVTVGIGWSVGKFWQTPVGPPTDPAVTAQRGPMLFQIHCASCHGSEGHGDGTAAAELRPPPRDFAVRPWRFAVTKKTIRKVVLDGIPDTAMPASRDNLNETDLATLVDHVFHLATSRPPVIAVPTPGEQALREAGFVDLRGTKTPNLTVSAVSGKTVKLADFKGRLLLIHFWGMQCVHCLKEMPHLHKLESELAPKGLTILHVCADAEDASTAQELASKFAPGIQTWVDDSGLGMARFEVQALPTVWLIGTDGQALGRTCGAKDWTAPALRKLLETNLPSLPKD